MDDTTERIWEKQDGESARWYQQFERYRLLGPDRSLLAACNQWRSEKFRKVQTRAPRTWRDVAAEWRWRERAEAWDKHLSDRAAAEAEAKRMAILTGGFAQRHERVRALDDVAQLLLDELYETNKRWLPDVKQIGSGENAEKVELVRFNAGLVKELRGVLDDLAAEMGERVKKRELSGPEGGPIPVTIREVVHELPADDGADDLEG